MKKIRPRKWAPELLPAKLCTAVCIDLHNGHTTGGFFGDALAQIGKITGMPDGWGELCLFSPMTDVMTVLIGAMVPLIHLNVGMVISVVAEGQKRRRGRAFWEVRDFSVGHSHRGCYDGAHVGSIGGAPVVLLSAALCSSTAEAASERASAS